MEKSSNQAIFHHFDQARKDYTTNITEKDSKNTNKVVEDAADFMNFLVQVDEVVRPRYNMAIQKNLITPFQVHPDITAVSLPTSLDELISENNKNMKMLEYKLGDLYKPYTKLLAEHREKSMAFYETLPLEQGHT